MNVARAQTPFTQQTLSLNLRRFCYVRLIVLLVMTFTLLYANLYLHMENTATYISAVLLLEAAIVLATLALLRRGHTTTEHEFLFHIVIHLSLATVVAYFSGGATNPFVSYFLVPISIAAAILPRKHATASAVYGLACYTLLLLFFQGTHRHSTAVVGMEHAGDAHFIGMWFNFILSAALIAGFVSVMAQALRQREQQINQQREQQMLDEQILSIASLSAGTAHELATPLNSIALLVDEARIELEHHEQGNDSCLHNDLELIYSQVQVCKKALEKLVDTARKTQPGAKTSVAADQLLSESVLQIAVVRPDAAIATENLLPANGGGTYDVHCDDTLCQALSNLINNAVNVSPKEVTASIEKVDGRNEVLIRITDGGGGIPDSVLNLPLTTPITNTSPGASQSPGGMGFGLFLANASIERHGGRLSLANENNGGVASVFLPTS